MDANLDMQRSWGQVRGQGALNLLFQTYQGARSVRVVDPQLGLLHYILDLFIKVWSSESRIERGQLGDRTRKGHVVGKKHWLRPGSVFKRLPHQAPPQNARISTEAGNPSNHPSFCKPQAKRDCNGSTRSDTMFAPSRATQRACADSPGVQVEDGRHFSSIQ